MDYDAASMTIGNQTLLNQSASNATGQLDAAAGEEQKSCETEVFFFVVYGPLYGTVCVFGLLGNSLSFAVLHKYSRNNVATYLLKALAVMDNLFLATAALIQMYQAMTMYLGKDEQLVPVYPYLRTYAWPVAHIIQLGTVWIMLLVATNRYIAVCKPLHASRLCTKRNVKIQICVMSVAIVIYNIPRFFEFKSVMRNVTDSSNVTRLVEVEEGLTTLHWYNILYENVAYCLVVFLIPLITLIVLNVHLVHDLKKAQRSRKVLKMPRTSSIEENNITLVMIIIIVVFIVCQLPASINQILYYVVDHTTKVVGCSSYEKYYHLCNLLITLNSSANFVIYCLFRRQFQQELAALLCPSRDRGLRRPLRKTLILRALHDRTSSSYLRSSSTKSTNMEDVPLKVHYSENTSTGYSENHGSRSHAENHHAAVPSKV